MNAKKSNHSQDVAAIVGVTVGIIPLVQVLAFDRVGLLWSYVVEDPNSTRAWLLPAMVLTLCAALVFVFEKRKS